MKKNLFLFFCIYVIIFLIYLFVKGVLFMKKSGFSLKIILFVFSFFLFNTDVYAAQELTCLYEKGGVEKVVLQQDSSGKVIIYKNKHDVDFSGKVNDAEIAAAEAQGRVTNQTGTVYSDWETVANPKVIYDSSVKKSGGALTECPKSKTTNQDFANGLTGKYGEVTFYGNNKGNQKLEFNSNKVETVETNRKATVQASQQLTIDMKFTKITISSCEDLFKGADDLLDLIKSVITVVKIAIPLILIVTGTMDFAQAIFASNEDGIKKAQSKFTRRVIIAVVIFLIPSILKALLSIAHSVWPIVDATLCGII